MTWTSAIPGRASRRSAYEPSMSRSTIWIVFVRHRRCCATIAGADWWHVRRNVAIGGGTRAAIVAINASSIGPGPLGIADTSPSASAPASIAIVASTGLAMQQTLMRGMAAAFIRRAKEVDSVGRLAGSLRGPARERTGGSVRVTTLPSLGQPSRRLWTGGPHCIFARALKPREAEPCRMYQPTGVAFARPCVSRWDHGADPAEGATLSRAGLSLRARRARVLAGAAARTAAHRR